MHSVTLVSGNPNILIAAFRRAGSPKPKTTVRNTENDTRSAARSTGSGAILTEWCVYFPGEVVRITDGGVTAARPPTIPQAAFFLTEGRTEVLKCNRKRVRDLPAIYKRIQAFCQIANSCRYLFIFLSQRLHAKAAR